MNQGLQRDHILGPLGRGCFACRLVAKLSNEEDPLGGGNSQSSMLARFGTSAKVA
jgi:hypothetical protein